jgi:hypothetical protein
VRGGSTSATVDSSRDEPNDPLLLRNKFTGLWIEELITH